MCITHNAVTPSKVNTGEIIRVLKLLCKSNEMCRSMTCDIKLKVIHYKGVFIPSCSKTSAELWVMLSSWSYSKSLACYLAVLAMYNMGLLAIFFT